MSDPSRPTGGWLSKLWPKRLITQTIVVLLLALLISQVVAAIALRGEARSIFRGVEARVIAERVGPVVTLLRASPPEMHDQVARTLASRRTQVWFTKDSPIPPNASGRTDEDEKRARDLVARLAAEIGDPDTSRVRAVVHEVEEDDDERRGSHRTMMRHMPPDARHVDAIVSINIDADHWLNAGLRLRPPRRAISPDTWIAMGITGVVLSVIVALLLGGITRPLKRLTDAAARLGRGETVEPVPEQGPIDVRETIRAFNDMQARLDRFVGDRTRMLAAVSHDLRTPITSLRLRAEMIDDAETRDKMIQTLDEMKAMTETTLAFAREDATKEETRPTDIGALVGSIADDLGDLGREVEFDAGTRVVVRCRPTSLARSLRNLIENATTYGARARIRISETEQTVQVHIDDDGPGIPEADRERVFQPFVRLETSRNRDTGGIGLGMAIARDIVRGHGGDILLANRAEGGLSVTVTLPKS